MSSDLDFAVSQWIEKAAEDWSAVAILTQHTDFPRTIVCFHCQQYLEKLFKGLLTNQGIEAPKTHSLRRLIQMLDSGQASFTKHLDNCDLISAHSVASRYPDDYLQISESEVNHVIESSREIGSIVKSQLNIEN